MTFASERGALPLSASPIRLLAVLGRDVSRSLSPRIHHAAARAMGLNLVYIPLCARDASDFRAKVDALAVLEGLGANVTIPFKLEADAISGERTEVARAVGAVNTLTFRSDGVIEGDNTDGPGMLRLLRACGPKRLEVVRILGAGGAARAVAWAARAASAGLVEVAARRSEQAEAVACAFGARVAPFDGGEAPTLVVSTLPNDEGLAREALERWVDRSRDPRVIDLAYSAPDTPSPLVREARRGSLMADDGLGLLVEQGALAFVRWTGAPLGPVREAMYAALGRACPSID